MSEELKPRALATLGDAIECDLHSWPFKLREKLVTPQSVAYANHLLMQPSPAWRLVPRAAMNQVGAPS